MKIDIIKLTSNGFGLGYENSRPVFVPKSAPGDMLEIEIIKEKKDFAEGIIKQIIEPSPNRITAPCPYFDQCGGCEHQNISYPDQLKFKEEIFKELIDKTFRSSLSRTKNAVSSRPQAASNNIDVLPISAGSDQPFFYRNSIRFFFIHKNDGKIAFGRSHFTDPSRLIEIDSCMLQSETTNRVMKELKQFINENIDDKNSLWQLKIREGKHTGEFMVEIITTFEEPPEKEGIVEVLKKINNIKSVYHTVAPAKSLNNMHRHLIFGSPIIHEKIGKYNFQISPESFFQTNSLGVKTLYDKIKEFAEIEMGERVLDLYCGTGTIGIYLSALAKEVVGVESVAQAVRDAADNAKLNKVSNINFFYQDSLEFLSFPTLRSESRHSERIVGTSVFKFDVIIVDPPRAGLNKKVIDLITKTDTNKIVYVSCNPTTFARDIKIFENYNYQLRRVQPIDMFPQTHHLEIVGLFQKLSTV